jgi:phosphoglycerol transferase MdoB-like AlkP superfamily enzyme
MNNYYKHLLLLLKRLILLLLLFQLSRLLFLLFNLKYFDTNLFAVIESFFYGFRFDWYIIAIFNSPFILIQIIPGKFKNSISFQAIIKYYFFIINSALILLNFVDIEYFKFTSKRATYDMINMINSEGLFDQLSHFINDFWYIALSWIIFVIILVLSYPKYRKVEFLNFEITKKDYFVHSTISIVIILLLFISVRGIGPKSTSIGSATSYTNPRNIPLLLNTPFTIIKSYTQDDLEMKMYIPESSINEFYTPIHIIDSSQFKPYNVMIITFRGLSKKDMGYYNDSTTHTPFLDSLFNESLTFEYSYSNGNTTIDAIPAILASIPSLSERSYLYSRFVSNSIHSLPEVLTQKGYQTFFIHGAKKRNLGFNHFAKLTNIDHYICRKDISKKQSQIDDNRCVYDEFLFNHSIDVLNQPKPPFFAYILTSTVQHPYSIPNGNNNSDIDLRLEQTIKYTDKQIEKFFNEISDYDWFDHTLFIITGDQPSYNSMYETNNDLDNFSVPIAFYCKSDTQLLGRSKKIIQHIDIFPSVLNYLGIKDSLICFGNDLFNSTRSKFAINYKDGIYQFLQNDICIQFDGNSIIGAYHYKTDTLFLNNLLNTSEAYKAKLIEIKLKSVIQQFNNRMIKNEMMLD